MTNSPPPISEFNPSMPETVFLDNLEQSLAREIRAKLNERNIVIDSSFIHRFDAAIDRLTLELHRQIYFQEQQLVRSRIFEGDDIQNFDIDDFYRNQNREIDRSVRSRLNEQVELIAYAIANVTRFNSQDSRERGVISNYNFHRIQFVIEGLKHSLVATTPDTHYVIEQLSMNDTIPTRVYEAVFTHLTRLPHDIVGRSTRELTRQIINQNNHDVSESTSRILQAATMLKLMNSQQLTDFINYTLQQSESNPNGVRKVLSEVAFMNTIPFERTVSIIRNSPYYNDYSTFIDNLISQLNQERENFETQYASSLRDLETASIIGSHEITNMALNPGSWGSLAAFYGSIGLGALNMMGSILSRGFVDGVIEGVPGLLAPGMIATVAFDSLGGQNSLSDMPRRLASRFAVGKEERQRISEYEWKNRLTVLTLPVNQPEVTEIFSSNTVINILRELINTEAVLAELNLELFEQHLRERDNNIYNLYVRHYASRFRGDRQTLNINLLDIALAYHELGIRNKDDYMRIIEPEREREQVDLPTRQTTTSTTEQESSLETERQSRLSLDEQQARINRLSGKTSLTENLLFSSLLPHEPDEGIAFATLRDATFTEDINIPRGIIIKFKAGTQLEGKLRHRNVLPSLKLYETPNKNSGEVDLENTSTFIRTIPQDAYLIVDSPITIPEELKIISGGVLAYQNQDVPSSDLVA